MYFKTFSNSSLAPTKLLRHLHTNHSDYEDKPIKFLKRELDELNRSKASLTPEAGANLNERAFQASLQVSYCVAKTGKAHTIAETLIKPCIMDVAETVISGKFENVMQSIPLSNNTVARRIYEMSTQIEQEVITRKKVVDITHLHLMLLD